MQYNSLKSYIKKCPDTWVGALLIELMERAASIPVFQSGGIVRLAQKVEEKYQNIDKKELVTIREAGEGFSIQLKKGNQITTIPGELL